MREIELGHGYKLQRRDSMNWELMHWHAPNPNNAERKSGEPKWNRCGKFYQTLDAALRAVYEAVLLEGGDVVDLSGALAEAERVKGELKCHVSLLGLGGAR